MTSTWKQPESEDQPVLKVFNTFTRSKVPFVPIQGNTIKWYSCGPTVYDSAHIGHARNYLTFDILRRIMRDYFRYNVQYVMNITDIDDKIIIRSRQEYLVKQFKEQNSLVTASLLQEVEGMLKEFAAAKLKIKGDDLTQVLASAQELVKPGPTDDDAKRMMYLEMLKKAKAALEQAKEGESSTSLLEAANDALAVCLDAKLGATVTDPKISRDLAAFWERDFLNDMRALNVLPPDVMTRVTEFVPEIVAYIEKIIANGYAYEANGSVYFSVSSFHGQHEHCYAKLCPQSAGNAKFFEEGEGALGIQLTGKKDPRDFALWKASKAGEPSWPSPWGLGRPGWHIECSVMAGSVMPGPIDIHSGGIDLAFPHHDNELAQSEAYLEHPQWVNYFLHAGHVHIEGHKMSKSLKNFITIKEALQRYSARQLRLMVLQHGWAAPVFYKESSMVEAQAADTAISNFFTNLAAWLREADQRYQQATEAQNGYREREVELANQLQRVQDEVHAALCDSFDTPLVLDALLSLISQVNVYVQASKSPQCHVLRLVGRFVASIFSVLGLMDMPSYLEAPLESSGAGSSGDDARLNQVIGLMSSFRDAVRAAALAKEDPSRFLGLCDQIRMDVLDAGVILEDRTGLPTLFKLISVEEAATRKREAENAELEKQARRLETLRLQEAKKAEKLARAKINPADLFRNDPAYSQFDTEGIPTHSADGQELSKNARKKVQKEWEQQRDLYEKHRQEA